MAQRKESWTLYLWLERKYGITERQFRELGQMAQDKYYNEFLRFLREWKG